MTNTETRPNPFIEHPAEYEPNLGGDQWIFTFPNGQGASVISHQYSYGGKSGLWELAVLGPDGRVDYKTPITDDVLGWLSVDDVRDALRKVAELPPAAS